MRIVYDGDGNRVKKTVAGGTTKYLVDELNPAGYAQVVVEIPSNGSNIFFVWGLEQISRRQRVFTPFTHNEIFYFVHDGLSNQRGERS